MGRPKAFDRDAALERAMLLFWERGYEATSVQDLVDGLGLNRSSLYATFGDKQRLYLEALDRYRRAGGAAMMADLDAPSAKEGIRRHFERIVSDACGAAGRRGCFVASAASERAPHDEATGQRAAESRDLMIGAFKKAVRRGQAAGEIPAERDATALARFLAAQVFGLRGLVKTGPPRAVLEDTVRVALAALD